MALSMTLSMTLAHVVMLTNGPLSDPLNDPHRDELAGAAQAEETQQPPSGASAPPDTSGLRDSGRGGGWV